MSPTSIRWWHIVLVLIAAPVLYLSFDWYRHNAWFRYRMTVEIEVDGKVHSASSVTEIRYSSGGGGGHPKPSWYAQIKGTAPIVDLGPYGYVVAAFAYDSADAELRNRGKQLGRVANLPMMADEMLLGAYNLGPLTITQARGKAVVTKWYPNFVWIPANSSWRKAEQLYHEDFESKIGSGVRLKQIILEPAPNAPFPTKVEHPPPWLVELRQDQPLLKILSLKPSEFSFQRWSFIEREQTKQ